MEEKLLRGMAVKSIALMLCVAILSVGISNYPNQLVLAGEENEDFIPSNYTELSNRIYLDGLEEQINQQAGQNIHVSGGDEDIGNALGERYVVIEKGSQSGLTVSLEDLFLSRSIRISIEGLDGQSITSQSVGRFDEGREYRGTPLDYVVLDPARALDISYIYNQNNFTYTAVLDITLDGIYAYDLYEDEKNIYVDLGDLHEEYDKIVVVDPGHGGTSPGTHSLDWEYLEKDFSLSIALYLKKQLDKQNIKVYYTRLKDDKVNLNPRKDLANEVNADLFLSIHCNGDTGSQANGFEVLYNENIAYSKEFAQICLDELDAVSPLQNRGLKERSSDVHIIRYSEVPVALMELGFMSNHTDLNYLLGNENRMQMAEAMSKAIIEALGEKK